MALTEEELKQQANVLATKTEDNPNMPYKANATLNKGLNPDYYSGQYTKIVNALNKLAEDTDKVKNASTDVIEKINYILLDTSSEDNNNLFNNVKELMGAPTIIEGIHNMLQGNTQEQLLNLKSDDIGKFLTVDQNDNGHLITKAIDLIIDKNASDIAYSNEELSEINNVNEALNFIVDDIKKPIQWDEIENIPMMKDSDVEDIIDGLNM